jgi:hypothetical protein
MGEIVAGQFFEIAGDLNPSIQWVVIPLFIPMKMKNGYFFMSSMKTFYVFEMLSLCLSFSSSVFVPKRNYSFVSFFFFFNFNALTSTIRKRMEMKRVSEPTSIISGPLILLFLPPWPGTPTTHAGGSYETI